MKLAEHYMMDSPLLNSMWEKGTARSETPETRAPSTGDVGSCEHAASQLNEELDSFDVDNEETAYRVSKIISDRLVPQSLYNDFNYEPDECLSVKLKIQKHDEECV